MSIELDGPVLPDKLIEFAKGVAKLAAETGVDRVDLVIRPSWRGICGVRDKLYGEVKIAYWQTDGRGRPSENLRVSVVSTMDHSVIYTPSSS